jgi:O-succinylbenzoate synthase
VRTLIDFDDAPVFAVPTVGRSGGISMREGVLIEGPQGWGEFSPNAGDDGAVLTRWLTAAIEAGTVGWPDPVRGRVPVAITVPAVAPASAQDIVAASGCVHAAVKVGDGPSSLHQDIARVEAVRDAVGPAGTVRCDADGSWDVSTALAAIAALEKHSGGMEFMVQPCRSAQDVAAVRRRVDVPIAVEVPMPDRHDPPGLPLTEVADIAILTCGPLGGVRRALRVAQICGRPVVVATAGASSVGLAAGLALSGVLPELPFACALDARPAGADLVSPGRALRPVDGYLPVAPMPPAPDATLLAQFAITDPTRIAWWRHRVRLAL